MSIEDKAQRAHEMIETQIGELLTILSSASTGGDYEYAFQRIDRWKSRTVNLLSDQINPNEGAKLENTVPARVTSWDPYADFQETLQEEVDQYGAFLVALLREVKDHPQDVFTPKAPSEAERKAAIPFQGFWSIIHPEIIKVSQKRFEDGHFADAVESAFKEVNTRVKDHVKRLIGQELDGSSLMNRAFSLDKPLISLDDLKTITGQSIQKGYMQIFSGCMTGIRNPKAHENIIIEKARSIHFLFLASLLMFKLDEAGTPSASAM